MKSANRRFQFRLRTFLVLVLVFATIFAGIRLLSPHRTLDEGEAFAVDSGMSQKEVLAKLGKPAAHFLNNKFWVYSYADSPWYGTLLLEFDEQGRLARVLREIDDPKPQAIR